jgi:hypothetical protein
MADDTKTAKPDAELHDLAFQIFAQRVAGTAGPRAGEQEALVAYRQAEVFLATKRKVLSGGFKPEKAEPTDKLSDACCPNQRATHPTNLVARLHTDRRTGAETKGDPQKVNRVKQWLDANPTPESNPDELVNRINRQFPELGWSIDEINTARAILPAYASN